MARPSLSNPLTPAQRMANMRARRRGEIPVTETCVTETPVTETRVTETTVTETPAFVALGIAYPCFPSGSKVSVDFQAVPCPFCFGDPVLEERGLDTWVVRCSKCFSSGPVSYVQSFVRYALQSQALAVSLWNLRGKGQGRAG